MALGSLFSLPFDTPSLPKRKAVACTDIAGTKKVSRRSPAMNTDLPITEILARAAAGEPGAIDGLIPRIYATLRRLARRQRMHEHAHTLDTTALVHEAYLKVTGQNQPPSESRAHFFAVASKAMRHILCNYARDRSRAKRGGGARHVRLESGHEFAHQLELSDDQTDKLAALDEALQGLERIAERQARVVECRFFGGMSLEDTATALGISPRTVKRDWTFARAWLRREVELKLDMLG